jgi:metallophosphoesterase superfamily enzyme
MVLPAFGVLAGGLNVLDRAFGPYSRQVRCARADRRRPSVSGSLLGAQPGLTQIAACTVCDLLTIASGTMIA